MIDDRRKPSAPPPPRPSDSVEILASDSATAGRQRRASRQLRVPNDPVPRRSSNPPAADDGELEARLTEPNLGAASRSIPPPPPDDETAAATSVAAISIVPLPSAVAGSSIPGQGPAALARPRSNPPPSGAPGTEPLPLRVSARPPSTAPSAGSSPPPSGIDPAGMVRQVRRKIRSVGTGSAPPPPRSPQRSYYDEPAQEPAPYDNPVSIPMPLVGAAASAEDDFVVPPVAGDDARREIAQAFDDLPPPTARERARTIETPSAFETFDADDGGESVEVSIEESSAEDARVADAAAAFDALVEEEEVFDEPAEEIALPDDAEDDAPAAAAAPTSDPGASRERSAPPPAPGISGAGKKPPPPPAKPPTEASAAAKPAPSEARDARATIRDETPRKKRRPWWEELFNDDYFRTMPRHSPAQVAAEGDFIEASLGVEKGATVLDLACGDGRQAIELATRGYEVVALDLSLPMLSRAADGAQDRAAKLTFLHSDMREMEFNEMFDAAYCMNTSFGFFEDDKNADVARRLHRALKTGGTLLLGVLNRDFAIQNQPSMSWYEGDGCVCMEETNFNYIASRLVVKRTMIFDDGRQREMEFSVRLYALHELGKMLHNVGFRVVEVSGHSKTPGAFFGPSSQELIILAQKNVAPGSDRPQAATTTTVETKRT